MFQPKGKLRLMPSTGLHNALIWRTCPRGTLSTTSTTNNTQLEPVHSPNNHLEVDHLEEGLRLALLMPFHINSFQKYIYMEQVIIFINLLLWFIIWLPYRVYCEWSHSLLGWGISVAKTNKNRIIHCHKDSVKNVRYKTILTNYGITFYWHCVVLLVGE